MSTSAAAVSSDTAQEPSRPSEPSGSKPTAPPPSAPPSAPPSSGSEWLAGTPPSPPLERGQLLFRTLGAAEIHVGPDLVVGPTSERMFALLSVVAMSPEHRVARARLLELVWPDLDEESARHSLRQHTYRLRQHGIRIEGTRAGLQIDRAMLLPCFALDRNAALFERDVLRGQEPFGHLFAGWVPAHAEMREWIEVQRDQYHADVRRVLIPELRRLRDRAQWMECERWARTVLEFDAYNEDATLILAQALVMSGSRLSASTLLETYVRETGASGSELGRRVEREHARILRSGRVTHEQTATRTLIGRDDVLSALDAITMRALQGEAQLVQLRGPAGIGKTEVAYEVTRRAVLLGFARAVVRASRPVGQMPYGTLSRLTRDLLELPGSLGCKPANLHLLRQFAGVEPTTSLAEQLDTDDPAEPLTECLLELIGSIAEERPLFIFLDDLQYVDRASIYQLQRVTDAFRKERVLFLSTVRATGDEQDDATSTCLCDDPILLTSLSFAHSAVLAESVSTSSGRKLDRQAAERIARVGATSPLKTITLAREQLVQGLTYKASTTLLEALARQLAELADAPRTLLAVLAVLGGKASIAEIDSILQISIVDRLGAVRTLLEGGLATATASSELQAHDEVVSAALQALGTPERQILKLHVAKILVSELERSFNTERAIAALSLAQDSGDRRFFVDSVLRITPKLVSAGAFQGALQFLAHARDMVSDPGLKERLLEQLVWAAHRAADWTTVLLNTKHLHRMSPTAMTTTHDLQLSEIEAKLQSALEDSGRSEARRALVLARSAETTADQRVRALRLVIAASADLFESDLAISAHATLRSLADSGHVTQSHLLEPHMQFHTIFGDLKVAHGIAEATHSSRADADDSTGAVRLLTNASHVLRVCGDFKRARECIESVLDHPALVQSVSRKATAYWRLSLIEADAERFDQAIHWGRALRDLSSSYPELRAESWCALYLLRCEQLETGSIRDTGTARKYARVHSGLPTRLHVYSTAVALNSARPRDPRAVSDALFESARSYLAEYGRLSGQDYLAVSLLALASRIERVQDVESTIHTYFARDRRELSPLPAGLAQIPEAVRTIIESACAIREESRPTL